LIGCYDEQAVKTHKELLRGIRWALFTTLEDLDFADDLSHTHKHIREKKSRLNTYAQQIGPKKSQEQSEAMTLDIPNSSPAGAGEWRRSTHDLGVHLVGRHCQA